MPEMSDFVVFVENGSQLRRNGFIYGVWDVDRMATQYAGCTIAESVVYLITRLAEMMSLTTKTATGVLKKVIIYYWSPRLKT